jgi:hypothetical protein
MIDRKQVQGYIEESENQNVVNETRDGFEVYQDNNLLQIRVKNGVALIS